MPYPNFPKKHREKAFITPEAAILGEAGDKPPRYFHRDKSAAALPTPEAVVLCYQNSLLRHILEQHQTTRSEQGAIVSLYALNETKNRVAVKGGFGIGAPAAIVVLEELIVQGVQRFLSVGTAGSLQEHVAVGDIVVCDRAIRDEGTSHHYLPPEKYAHASPSLTARLVEALRTTDTPHSVGTSWTIDAPYRETVAEVQHYQSEGVLTVEMEASALFAVAAHRGVEMGSLLTISDSLADVEWDPQFRSDTTRVGLETLYRVALQALQVESA